MRERTEGHDPPEDVNPPKIRHDGKSNENQVGMCIGCGVPTTH